MSNANGSKLTSAEQASSSFLFSLESYSGHNGVPNTTLQLRTVAAIILILFIIEFSLRQFFNSIREWHPVLEDETNRKVLARHIGVDAFSCFVVAYLGWEARHVVQDLIDATIGRKKNAMPVAYEGRMFTYHPEGQRVALFFASYQLKNTYDTIIWNDGLLFIVHHFFTLFTTWGALHGNGHFYVLFYFGVSEISTGVLSLLANFDDEYGVVGLADAFPIIKICFGGLFTVLFIICRVFMWSTISYYYCRDAWNVVKGSDPRAEGYKTWYRFTFLSLSILSVLQIIWLADIVRIGKEELEKLGIL